MLKSNTMIEADLEQINILQHENQSSSVSDSENEKSNLPEN